MSLLFENRSSINTSFSVRTDPDGSDIALVSPEIWDVLVDSHVETSRITLAITPRRIAPGGSQTKLQSLTCWAIRDSKTKGLSVPPEWIKSYGTVFPSALAGSSRDVLMLSLAQPILLTEVIVTAFSKDAYDAARAQDTILESWFADDRPILRQGAVHVLSASVPLVNGSVPPDTRPTYQYRIDMAEPVLQGYIERNATRILITLADTVDSTSLADGTLSSEAEDGSDSEHDGFEIDESFLARSVLTSIPDAYARIPNGSVSPSNGYSPHDGRPETPAPPTEVSYRAESLAHIVSPADDDCTLYLRTSDLGRIGVLNDDWAVVHPRGSSRYRLVRISANDDLVETSGVVKGSPLLLRNIGIDASPAFATELIIRGSPFGSRQPTIPVARNVTVARVASPFAVDRQYQPLFLQALKTHLDGMKRLMKQGDLLAVGIDTDSVRRLETEDESSEQESSDALETNFPSSPHRINEGVFFVITNIEHDVLPRDRDDSSASDMYVGSTLGELGCWVDPVVTRLSQTGVEHSRVPDVGAYLGLDSGCPEALYTSLIRMPSPSLLSPGSAFEKLLSLCSAALVQRAVDYKLHLSILLKGARGIGKFTVASWVAQRLGMHLLEVNCYDTVGDSTAKTEGTLRARFEKAASCSPCILVLRHIEAISQTTQQAEPGKEPALANILGECIDDLQKSWNLSGYPVIVFGTTAEPGQVPPATLATFKHEVSFEAPDESNRYEILATLLAGSVLSPDVSLSSLATQTAALVASDLVDLVTRATYASRERVLRLVDIPEADLKNAGVPLTGADFEVALGKARTSYSESIGAPKIPNVSWDDVGGLAHVKSDILDTIQLPLEHPELFADGLKKRSGILLYGPPGTGKTLLAKAVATSCSLNFFSVKGPELLNMYIGESEANVRRVFQRARDAKPCVIFFDELDSVAPKRGNHGDSGGVMDRIVSQLLAELDGMSAGQGGADVFVIGATNRPDLLDAALLRPGRFDRMLYLGVSETHQAQLNILEALTRKFRLDPGLDLGQVAEQCPFNYTGADFYALCSDAMLNAMSRKAEEVEAKIARLNENPPIDHPHPITPQYYLAEMAAAADIEVLVNKRDFDSALRELVPSVSQSEMDHYANIQRRFSRELSEDEE
ncbi:hypothetical protein PLICRDRAFT_42057 [Plicaturopsis crispa FD-325 SS-3]|nr:hypothetical protein PLICRDRAFT_42057 [Plicaturopsis crispa FD-325 SS-3]